MKNGVMLYRCPGPHHLNGIWCDYIIVLENQADQYISKGWSRTTIEANEIFNQSEPEPEPVRLEVPIPLPKPQSPTLPEKLKYEDFSDLEKDNIKRDKRPMKLLSEIHNTSYYTIRKIKGLT